VDHVNLRFVVFSPIPDIRMDTYCWKAAKKPKTIREKL
jgi:hypothetical protein